MITGTSEVLNLIKTKLGTHLEPSKSQLMQSPDGNFKAILVFKNGYNLNIITTKKGNAYKYFVNNKEYDREKMLDKLNDLYVKLDKANVGVDWKNPTNFKSCKKTVYYVWCCKPPIGTIVVNRLEHLDAIHKLGLSAQNPVISVNYQKEIKQKDPNRYQLIQQAIADGSVYVVGEEHVVLYGTVGEMWTVKIPKLEKSYEIERNGKSYPLSLAVIEKLCEKKSGQNLMPWTKIKAKAVGVNMACFVPVSQKDQQIMMYGGSTPGLINDSKIKSHGKGDFVLCYQGADGKPDLNDVWVVNGLIFATTYNKNWGCDWTKYIDTSASNIELNKPHPLYQEGVILDDLDEKMNFVEGILKELSNSAATEIPFKYQRKEDYFVIKSKIIEIYKKENKGEKEDLSDVMSIIRFHKDTIELSCYNVYPSGKKKAYGLTLPNTNEGLTEFRNKALMYCGSIGYVKGDLQSSFNLITPSKFEYDGVEAYTISSSGLARKLRFQDRDYEFKGVESQRLLRCIQGIDSYFDKCTTQQPIQVFRGMPLSVAFAITGAKSLDDLQGKIITNTGYTSTSINLQSTLMFANPPQKSEGGVNDGLIMAIDIPAGIHCDYIHNIAGWQEQFEVLLDRKYDIQIEGNLFQLENTKGFKYYITKGRLVEHKANEEIASFTLKCLKDNAVYPDSFKNTPELQHYDEEGRLNVDAIRIKDTLNEVFIKLKKEGLSNVQYQENIVVGKNSADFIVIRGEKQEDGSIEDIAFTLTGKTDTMQIFTIQGKDDSIRNYWTDYNRNNGSVDRNFSWDNYAYSEDKANLMYDSTILLKQNDGDDVTDSIVEAIKGYLKYNVNCLPYPLQDICRYFDTVMKQVILSEGYLLKKSIPIMRTGNENDENDGFVRAKYIIDGNATDSLALLFQFKKSGNKLVCTYKAQSENKKVDSTKVLSWDVFNRNIMLDTCSSILYEFAVKLDLNHTQKIDKFMSYLQQSKGLQIEKQEVDGAENLSIHDRGFYSNYRIYLTYDQDTYIDFKAEVGKGTSNVINIALVDSSNNTQQYRSLKTARIVELYKDFSYNMKLLRIFN